jgi:hypothetical protein
MNLLNKIIKLEEELYTFFGSMTFDELETQFGYCLHGLENDEVESLLDSIRNEWVELPLRNKYQIIEQINIKRK